MDTKKMQALVYNLNIPKYLAAQVAAKFFPRRYFEKLSCLHLREIPIPALPSDDWVLIKTEACGICGSDLSLLMGRDSFSMEPYSSFPAVLGHEAVGRITKAGGGVAGFKEGNRVAVDNILPCATRGIENPCSQCKSGNYSLCDNFTNGNLSAGPVNGYNASVGGGFGEYFLAHQSQLFIIPENMPTKRAILADPLASALQPAATHLPNEEDMVLVYGSGIIGILLINSLRALGCKSKIISISRYDFQAELAKKAGANEIIQKDLFNEFTKITGATRLKTTLGKPVFEGGVDIIFDCVGSAETIDNSLRLLKRRGKLVLVGTSGVVKNIDASPIWFKEVSITGSSMYSHIDIDGKKTRTYKAAIDMIDNSSIHTESLVTHSFDISDFKNAIKTAMNKRQNGSSKVVFKY